MDDASAGQRSDERRLSAAPCVDRDTLKVRRRQRLRLVRRRPVLPEQGCELLLPRCRQRVRDDRSTAAYAIGQCPFGRTPVVGQEYGRI